MANYCCAIRTNYFHVKNENRFRELMKQVYGSENEVMIWEKTDTDGKTVFGFGVYNGIAGLKSGQEDVSDDDFDESSYDEFIKELQQCVADDDAIIIMESGNEKLRYIVGKALIITNREYKYLNIVSIAAQKASEMLTNPDWETECEY